MGNDIQFTKLFPSQQNFALYGSWLCVCVGLTDCENNAITIVKTVVLTIMKNTMTIVGLVSTYLRTMIKSRGTQIC